MIIRPASFRDLGRIEHLHKIAAESERKASPLEEDSPVPAATLLRLWYAVGHTLTSLIPLTDSGDEIFVAEDEGDVVGFVQAQSVPGKPKLWQIVNLTTTSENNLRFITQRLLTAVYNSAMEAGITRLLVKLPTDHKLVPAFVEHGFTQFATEQILFTEDAGKFAPRRDKTVRSAHREDVASIYLLYLRTTPSQVASIEAPSQKLWQTTYAAGLGARVNRDDLRHLVAERSGLYGWAAIRTPQGPRPTNVTLMCEGQDPQAREDFVDAVLGELPDGPATCVLRHYDSDLIRALQQRGFAIYGTQLLLVRDLAAKVKVRAVSPRKKPVFVAAGVARSVPLTVLNNVVEKGIKRSLPK